jgi:predicted ArsR family transcriptional regulator
MPSGDFWVMRYTAILRASPSMNGAVREKDRMHKANGYTRQEILRSVKLNGSMTADELGRELGISPVAVRQHLASLEAEGLVQTSIERRGLGRPVHRYTITSRGDETFPRAYDHFATSLLDDIRSVLGDQAVVRVFESRRERIAASHKRRLEGRTILEKIEELAKIQSDAGFMAVSTTDGDDFILSEHNCAICQVARNEPSACAEEMAMFQDLLGSGISVSREKHILSGDSTCTYRIRVQTLSEDAVAAAGAAAG